MTVKQSIADQTEFYVHSDHGCQIQDHCDQNGIYARQPWRTGKANESEHYFRRRRGIFDSLNFATTITEMSNKRVVKKNSKNKKKKQKKKKKNATNRESTVQR